MFLFATFCVSTFCWPFVGFVFRYVVILCNSLSFEGARLGIIWAFMGTIRDFGVFSFFSPFSLSFLVL